MRTDCIALAAIALVLSAESSRAGECSELATQDEKISCLESAVEQLEQRLAIDRQRHSIEFERMIDEKIRKALEPRVWAVPR